MPFVLCFFLLLFGAASPAMASLNLDEAEQTCKYQKVINGNFFMDIAKMYQDALFVGVALVNESPPPNAEGRGFLKLNFLKVFKGDPTTKLLSVDYTEHLCSDAACGGNRLPVSPKNYLFFLVRGENGMATRLSCYGMASNGWVDAGALFFNEKFSIPFKDAALFFKDPEAKVPLN